MQAGTAGKPIVLAHPRDAHATRILVLPHPRSAAPAYFAVTQGADHASWYELLVVRGDQSASRSWMVSPGAGGSGGSVIADGALRVFSPVDPAFVLLGILADEEDPAPRRLQPLEDLLDAAAERHARRRAAHAGADAPAQWADIGALAHLPHVAEHLAPLCDTEQVGSGSEERVYGLSWDRVLARLDAKLARMTDPALFERAPDTLGRQMNRRLDAEVPAGTTPTENELAAARRGVALDVITGYLPPALAQRWAAHRGEA